LGVFWIDQLEPSHASASVLSKPVGAPKYPTAVQTVTEPQDTAFSWLLLAPLGSGAFSIVQLEPFQTSASIWLALDPTATHTISDPHETPSSALSDGCGAAWIFQLPALHTSISSIGDPPAVPKLPTAVHSLADAHDTAFNCPLAAPAGLGGISGVQRFPFQASASGVGGPFALAFK